MDDGLPGPVLLVGAGGMLGRAWGELLGREGIPFDAPGRDRLDLTRPATLDRWLAGPRYAAVVNCAGWTDVDGAEAAEDEATAVNGTGAGELAARCARTGALLLHYSTDYVFDGEWTVPYPTDAPRRPLSAYGRSKAAGEALVETSGCAFLMIRTSWLYAPWGRNFVRLIARLARERPTLRVVDDQRGRPTSAESLAAISLDLVRRGARGVFHVTDGGSCSWFELASEIGARVNPACPIEPCSTLDFPSTARRPAWSVLDLTATEAVVGPIPSWRRNLERVLDRLESGGESGPAGAGPGGSARAGGASRSAR